MFNLPFILLYNFGVVAKVSYVVTQARQQAVAPGMLMSVNVVPDETEVLFVAALAGSAVVTTKTTAIRVSPICFTISSKCLYYL